VPEGTHAKVKRIEIATSGIRRIRNDGKKKARAEGAKVIEYLLQGEDTLQHMNLTKGPIGTGGICHESCSFSSTVCAVVGGSGV
jgi:hypothetical protein